MNDIYTQKGMSQEDATLVVNTMVKYMELFIDTMVAEELVLQVPGEDHRVESFKKRVMMFCSFACFGSLPFLGYVIIPTAFPDMGTDSLFITACVVTGVVLFIMGCVKSMFMCLLVSLWDGNPDAWRSMCYRCLCYRSVRGCHGRSRCQKREREELIVYFKSSYFYSACLDLGPFVRRRQQI